MFRIHHAAVLAALTLLAQGASADAQKDADMKKLADSSGCFVCHSIEPGRKGPNGLPPIGPPWQEVAKRYAGKPGAEDFLTRVVLEGTNPYASHWTNQVSGLAMPPNAVAIKPRDARELVGWILALPRP